MKFPALPECVVALVAATSACASARPALSPSPFPGALPPAARELPPEAHPVETTSQLPILEAEIVRNALDLRGVPYRPGGDSPAAGFDCSGFVHYVFAQQNIDVPRTVAEQFTIGYPAALSDVREGDLVFFTTIAPGPSHVGLALGHGEFIHAPSRSGTVRVERLDTQYWHDRIVAVKRIF